MHPLACLLVLALVLVCSRVVLQVPKERAVPALPAGDDRAVLHRPLPDLLGDGQHDPGQ